MSRSGYCEDIENWSLIRWRGQVASAIRGKRGQAMLRELLGALDAMPEKKLITGTLQAEDGAVCAIGCLGKAKGFNMKSIDPEDPDAVAEAFNIAPQLAQEIVYENDERGYDETPEQLWARMRKWVADKIVPCSS